VADLGDAHGGTAAPNAGRLVKAVATLIVQAGSDPHALLDRLSALDWAQDVRIVGENKLLVRVRAQNIPDIREKERIVIETEGVRACTILTTQYFP